MYQYKSTGTLNLGGMASPKFLIYGLVDPRTGQLRYVGKSSYGIKRAQDHGFPAKLAADKTYCGNWIRQLKAAGPQHQYVVIDEHPDGEWLSQAEIFWIAYFRRLGCCLTNLTDGGEGQLGVVFSAERRLSIAKGHGARPFMDENGNLHHSVRAAARALGTYHNMISQVLLGRRKSIHGHTFKYVE